MKIGIIGSMQNAELMVTTATTLRHNGHEPIVSLFVESVLGKSAGEQERIKLDQKNNEDAMRRDVEQLVAGDAILVLNTEKNGQANYIGGNAFLEMGMAYFREKKIFLLNPIPDNPYYRTEIEAMKPVVIDGDLTKIQ